MILCYCGFVKNLTVSVPDEVYRAARVRAAEEDSSLSALVAAYLRSFTKREEDEFARLEAQQEEVLAEIDHFSARDRLSRDELHERAVR